MSKLKMFAMTALAVAAIVVGGLVTAPSASAAPKTCEQALALSMAYIAIGDVLVAYGHSAAGAGYYGRAQGVVEAAC